MAHITVHFEITSKDYDCARKFYAEALGWSIVHDE